MNDREEYTTRSLLEEVKRLMAEGNEQGAYEFIKTVNIAGWNGDELYPPLYAYNSKYIFNGLLCHLLSSQQKLDMLEKYKFEIFPENQERVKEAMLDCGKLGIEEVYEYASKKKHISKEALQNCKWTPEWVDKFIALEGETYLYNSLLENVDMTFEQFVSILDKNKKRDEKRNREWEKQYPKAKREERKNYPTSNLYAKYQISRFYPLKQEQEETLKPYCEYEMFMNSLKMEPTYEKIITALESDYYASQGHNEIGNAIRETKLTDIQQLEVLNKATAKIQPHYLKEIASGLIGNKSLSADTLIAMCKVDAFGDFNIVNSLFGYSESDEEFMKVIATIPFTEEQKEKFKTSKIFIAFDGAVKRKDFTFDDCLEMLKNKCNYTSEGISELVSRFVAIPQGDRWSHSYKFNNENELKLAQLNSWLATDKLLEVGNPNTGVETLICFAKTPLDCSDQHNSPCWKKDEIFADKIMKKIFTDEQFDRLLQTANGFEQPTNPHVIRERDQKPLNWSEFYETIPNEDRSQYFTDSKTFKTRQNWANSVNTGLIKQKGLSFERLFKILETIKECKTEVYGDTLDRIVNSTEFTISQLEKMIELGFDSLRSNLEEMQNNPSSVSTPNKLAIVDFEAQTIELPTNENSTFYVIDVREGYRDCNGNPIATKRIYLPKQCNQIKFDGKGESIKIYPSDYNKTESRYGYGLNSGKLSSWNDYEWEFNLGDNTIDDAVVPINESLIDNISNQKQLIKERKTKK